MRTGMHPCAFMLVHMLEEGVANNKPKVAAERQKTQTITYLRFPMPGGPITDNSPSKNDFVLYGNISDGGCQL